MKKAGKISMLAKLFRRLTEQPGGEADRLFDAVTAVARQPHWYVEGGVPDNIDGRFAMLASVAALVSLRLEALGDAGDRLSAALTGRFAEVMDSEHRELGVGEPSLGKTVLKLVGKMEKRVDRWRTAERGSKAWEEAVIEFLPLKGTSDAQSKHCFERLSSLRDSLDRQDLDQLREGTIL
jgi:cytochrome b pre-mRNA-processing protein 3